MLLNICIHGNGKRIMDILVISVIPVRLSSFSSITRSIKHLAIQEFIASKYPSPLVATVFLFSRPVCSFYVFAFLIDLQIIHGNVDPLYLFFYFLEVTGGQFLQTSFYLLDLVCQNSLQRPGTNFFFRTSDKRPYNSIQ